jgi:hypothetical protein
VKEGLEVIDKPATTVMSPISILSGEYYVTYKVNFTGPQAPYTDFYNYNYLLLDISNVASNTPDSMLIWERRWRSDLGIYEDVALFKSGCNVSDTSHITINGANVPDSLNKSQPDLLPLYRNYKFIKGRLINGGGRSKSGIREDSIFFYYRYADLPDDTIYILISGCRKSGFIQDQLDH